MKTGIIVLGLHSDSEDSRYFAERCAEYLRKNGRKNVFPAFYRGTPFAGDVMRMMHDDGIDTFCILPLTVSEGKHTVWLMPDSVFLPDNFCSWTMLDDKDVATRFSTALGSDQKMAELLVQREGTPVKGTGILLVNRGSPHSSAKRDAAFYTEAFRQAGWDAEFASAREDEASEAAHRLIDDGNDSITVIPLFIRFSGKYSEIIRKELEGTGCNVSYSDPITEIPEYMEILDSKVPDGW
jgi:sirohydrochlorin ferrochelatase